MRYDGHRYQAECRLAGKTYGQRFGVDVGFGDPMHGEIEVVTGDDLLAFAGIPPPRLRVYPVETHLAEKLHAYTLPRERPNSRVKDLPDLALLGTVRPLDARTVRAAMERIILDRQEKTGESYTAARAHVMGDRARLLGLEPSGHPTPASAERADAVVLKVTTSQRGRGSSARPVR